MFSALKSLFSSPAHRNEAHALYVTVVEQARQPVFYERYGVSDTLDGRFDVIVLHLFLVIHRLRGEPQGSGAASFIRALQEVFFADMDRSVREMGVSDTGVGKRIKAMAQAFYGRLQAYERGLDYPEELQASLVRNLYRGQQSSPVMLQFMQDYIMRNNTYLAQQEAESILAGRITFSG